MKLQTRLICLWGVSLTRIMTFAQIVPFTFNTFCWNVYSSTHLWIYCEWLFQHNNVLFLAYLECSIPWLLDYWNKFIGKLKITFEMKQIFFSSSIFSWEWCLIFFHLPVVLLHVLSTKRVLCHIHLYEMQNWWTLILALIGHVCQFFCRCSQRHACPDAGVHPLRYVRSLSNCVEFASIKPEQVPLGPSVEVWIPVCF